MGLDMYLEAHLPTNDELRALHTVASERLAGKYNIDKEDGSVFVCAWDFEKEPNAEADVYAQLLKDTGLPRCEGSPMATLYADHVEVNVAYWRKANAIHQWFVDNCMGGVDECVWSEPIPRSKLRELKQLCERVINQTEMVKGDVCNGYTFDSDGMKPILEPGELMANTKQAEKLLPTQSGFFFGSTDYDEYYIQALKHTVEQLTEALRCPKDTVFRYRPSW
jgi:hypothetical protein